ncbi:MAG: ABC transporter ATP-binding protein [Geminicoccaceae bacterium]
MTALLELAGVSAAYLKARILFDIDLAVGEREVVALVGRNGAGKSTTIKAVMGIQVSRTGAVHFAGRDVSRLPAYMIARLGIGYVPEERRVFPELTILENLEVGCQPAREGAPTWTPEALFEIFPNLAELRHRPAGQSSGGEQQMLAIARTLMGNPRLVLLDEPSEGLAPVIVEQMAVAVGKLKQEGLAVLLSEQNLRFAGAVADRAYVIESGHIRFEGPMRRLLDDAALRSAHLSV